MKEISFYADDRGVRITNSRAIIGHTTYMMANITSVSKSGKDEGWRSSGIVIAVTGFILVIISIVRDFPIISVIGIIGLIAGVLIAIFYKPTYTVKIGSASGEVNAVSSKDENYIQGIVNAFNEAFIKMGEGKG